MRRLTMLTFVLGLLAMAAPAWAGWVIDQVTKGGGDERQDHRLMMQANRLKQVSLEGGRTTQAMVMDLDAQTITHIDYKERSFMTATAQEYAAAMSQSFQMMGDTMGKQMQETMKEMQDGLKDLPPEQRRQAEAMIREMQKNAAKTQGGRQLKPEDCAPDKVDVKSTGRKITVAGYDASGYQVFTNGKLDSEVWIAPGITAVREIDPKKLERMMTDMMKALPQCPPRGQMFGADPMWKLMKDGYPVRTVDKEGGQVTEVVKAESRSIAAAEWEPPAGFARKTLKDMMGGK